MPPLRHAFITVLGALFIIGAATWGITKLIVPSPPPPTVAVPPPFGAPLTPMVCLVVIDGLRYDVGTDPAWMPKLAARFKRSAHGEIWSSPVSMTSSAVLTYGTGQRGDMDQIVNNESGSKTGYHHLLASVRAAGLRVAVTGDHSWFQLYEGAFDLSHPDPDGVALEIDYNAEIFAAAFEFLKATPRPALWIAHFVTPDHQAHAYGVMSDRYRAHIADFDDKVDALLEAIPKDAAAFVTSDHGATDNGTHGTDSPIQRRSPLLAYGQGIVPLAPGAAEGFADPRILEQASLPSTFAALLGVSAPASSRGHMLTDWLDATPERRAELACADLERLRVYAEAEAGVDAVKELGVEAACRSGAPTERIQAAADMAVLVDDLIARSGIKGSPWGVLVPVGTLLLSLLLSLFAARQLWGLGFRQLWPIALAFAAQLAVTLALLLELERLPGNWHARLYVTIMALGFGVLLVGLARYRKTAGLLDRRPEWLALIMPGLLVITYTRTAQPVSYVTFAILLVGVLLVGVPRAEGGFPTLPARWRLLARPWEAILGIVLVAALWRVGFRGQDYLYGQLESQPTTLFVVALASLAAYGVFSFVTAPRSTSPGSSALVTSALTLIAGLSLWARKAAPPWVCLLGWPLLALLGIGLAWRGRRHDAELAFIGSYAFVSRDAEIPLLMATLAVANLIGRLLGRYHELTRQHGPGVSTGARDPIARPSAVLWIITLILAWSFTQRVAVQLGLDFTYLDWGAAAFRDPDAPPWRIGAGIASKHILARGLLFYAIVAALPSAVRPAVAMGHLIAQLFRLSTLALMIYFARDSFWTSLRVMGDLPHALVAVFVGAVAVLVVALTRRSAEPPQSG